MEQEGIEALSWLKTGDGKERTIGESSENMDATDSLAFVQELYARGAVQVRAIEIEAYDFLETTSTLIVALSSDTSARARLFEMEAAIAEEGGFDPETDHGQKTFMLHW